MKQLVIKARELKDGDQLLESFRKVEPAFSIELGHKYVSFSAGETDHRIPLDHEIWVERVNPGICPICNEGFDDLNQEDVCAKCWADLEDVPE